MMVLIFAATALFIAWIWIDYYRLIDIYEKEKLKYIILTFLLGGASVYLVLKSYEIIDKFPWELNNHFINDFSYCVIKIGMVEELAKTLPFLLVFLFFRKQFNEPIDFLAFISISALGFSAVENIFYFMKDGPYTINSRAILSSVGHMFDTSLTAYGIILVIFKKVRFALFYVLGFFLLACVSHGFYDFWLLYENTKSGGWLITVLYFLVTISIFATILNNCLNNSGFFTYKKVIDSNKVAGRLLGYYAVVFAIQIVLLSIKENVEYAIYNFVGSLYVSGFIVLVTVVRLSRFKLIQGRWQKVKLELPFSLYEGKIRIKGEAYNEAYINIFYEEYFYLFPVSASHTEMHGKQLSYIEKKLFFKNDETFYLARLFKDDTRQIFDSRLIKPKTQGTTMMYDKYPIVAVLKIQDKVDLTDMNLSRDNFAFQEWCYIQGIKENPQQ